MKHCLVQIPADTGSYYPYELAASSSMEAAAKALERHARSVPDDTAIIVILDGISPLLWDAKEHNSKQPTIRHRVASVRKWLRDAEWVWVMELFQRAGVSIAA